MGWRQGRGVGKAGTSSAEGQPGRKGSRWGREAGVGAENTPLYEVAAKADLHGLGFDPFRVSASASPSADPADPRGGVPWTVPTSSGGLCSSRAICLAAWLLGVSSWM